MRGRANRPEATAGPDAAADAAPPEPLGPPESPGRSAPPHATAGPGRRAALLAGAAAALLPALTATPARARPAGAAHPGGEATAESAVRPAPQMRVEPGDTPERIIAKAANIVPRKGQLAWQQRRVTAFTHFGMNTFTDREWGSGTEDEAWFAPGDIDVEQWMAVYRAAGAQQAMLTAKHHDGFVLYPTRYTPHSVAHSPGRPDVLGRYVKAARAAGLRVGVYLSPADGAELPHAWHARWVESVQEKKDRGEQLSLPEEMALADKGRAPAGLGRYGNGSAVTEHTIPTLVPGDDRTSAVRSGRLPSFTVHVNDYDAFYLNQVYELFTQYGPLDELWLDGANPWRDAGVTQTYAPEEWFRLIHALSPDTVVFAGPQGVRWVGNEDGVARETEWSVTPSTVDPWTVMAGGLPNDSTDPDIGSREKLLDPATRYLQWYPAEADVSVRPGWFHHPDEHPKSAGTLVDLYEKSVGRNACLLLNIPPAKDGRIEAADVEELTAFGDRVRATYGTDLLGRGHHGPATFDRVRLAEDVRHGQRVESFTVQARVAGAWRDIAEGTTIGACRILPLPAPVTADAVRVHVGAARATPRLLPVTVHRSTP
ncbi:alpha-L-fucosidase [Streptomyces sp. NPDC059740]|uniref:alpha-L-fucosidase n=1 Tax=Streptomyces sp. NPDC059740 TaxID=3346926 RepID=UPI00365B3B19